MLTSRAGKPTALAGATTAAAAPKKSVDATRPAETEAPAAEAAGPVRTGSSSSSSSSDAEKKDKKKATKSKSRSASRKRASIFGGLLGKKDKADEPIPESEATKEESVAPQIGETSTTAPVITSDIPKTGDELNAEATPAPVVAETAAPAPVETETAAPVVAPAPVEKDDKTIEKPKPTKRGSIFGSFFEKVKSPSHEKKEADLIPAAAAPKEETPVVPELQKPVEETPAVVPATEATTEAPLAEAKLDAPKTEAVKPVTPVKEKEHFSFGKFFGNKEKAKTPAVETPAKTEEAPKVEEATSPVVANGVEPVVPVAETSAPAAVEEKKEETATPKKEKRTSIFGQLARTVSKAGGKKEPKEKKETVAPATVEESAEPTDKAEVPAVAETKEETPVVPAQQSTIGDVTPESVNVGEAPKSSAPVATTA
ncbi:hypothetical protein B5807_09673 [Epicoccum nigrum]|jgi:hypothetical protein|uniref:Uncharacterized protein n=1 Tax=Epicoccum nigrum TaxID=105696 RepID=A0A1Y2LPJ4_EPING|nr:hypothetical protein B5807_09673 [Epicoccum nigrum]